MSYTEKMNRTIYVLVIGPLFILSVQNYKASCAVERSFVMHDAGCQEILYFIRKVRDNCKAAP